MSKKYHTGKYRNVYLTLKLHIQKRPVTLIFVEDSPTHDRMRAQHKEATMVTFVTITIAYFVWLARE